jgi:lysophospholipase L1-like esterase
MTKKELAFSVVPFLIFVLFSTFLLAELAVRVIAARSLIYNIEMVKYARQLKIDDPFREISHIHRPNAAANLMGVQVSLNSLGHRGGELLDPKPQGTKRVLVLGNSVTLGWGVPYQDVFTSVVERRLNEQKPFGRSVTFEFDNAGVGNYNAVAEYVLFRRQYQRIHPDWVILQYLISDADPRPLARRNFILKHSYFADYLFYAFQIFTAPFGNQRDRYRYNKDLYADTSPAWKEALAAVEKIKAITAKNGIPFMVMITPDLHDLSDTPSHELIYQKIEHAFRRSGIPTFNTFAPFQSKYGKTAAILWVAPDDPHPNRQGHAFMAALLYQYIVDSNPLRLRVPKGRSRKF